MATKSFVKNVNLRSRPECQAFIRALEHSEDAPRRPQKQENETKAREMDKETIRKMFVKEDKK